MRLRARPFALALTALIATAAVPTHGALAQDEPLAEGPGKAELSDACTTCHGTGQITAQHRAPGEWSEVVERMVGFGATLDDTKKAQVLAYLNANYGKAVEAPATAAAPAAPAPAAAAAPADPAAKPN